MPTPAWAALEPSGERQRLGSAGFPAGSRMPQAEGRIWLSLEGLVGSGWCLKQRNERSRVRSCISSLPSFPGWRQECEKANNAQTPRGPAVTASPDISPTCFFFFFFPRQNFQPRSTRRFIGALFPAASLQPGIGSSRSGRRHAAAAGPSGFYCPAKPLHHGDKDIITYRTGEDEAPGTS